MKASVHSSMDRPLCLSDFHTRDGASSSNCDTDVSLKLGRLSNKKAKSMKSPSQILRLSLDSTRALSGLATECSGGAGFSMGMVKIEAAGMTSGSLSSSSE